MADFKIKITTDGGKSAADEIKKVGDATAQTTQKLDQSAATTEKATKSKNRLVDAFKKLKHEVPLAGAAVDAFKNPLTAVTIGFAVAANWASQFSERVRQMQKEVGDGKLADQFANIRKALAEAAVEGRKFEKVLEEIAARSETVTEKVSRLTAQMDRNLKVEAEIDERAKAAELADAKDPEARAAVEAKFDARAKQRDQRRMQGAANIQAQAQFRAADDAREALLALPAAKAALAEKRARLDKIKDSKRIGTSASQAELDALNDPSIGGALRNFLIYGSLEDTAASRTMYQDSIEGAERFNGNLDARQILAEGEFNAQRKIVDDLQSRVVSSNEAGRNFGIGRREALADAAAFQPFNDPGAAQSIANTRAAQAAFEDFIRRVILITNEGQQRVDAISRANKSQAQQ